MTTVLPIIPNTHTPSSHPDFHFDMEPRMFQGYHYFLFNFIWLNLTSHYPLQEIIFMQLGIISSIYIILRFQTSRWHHLRYVNEQITRLHLIHVYENCAYSGSPGFRPGFQRGSCCPISGFLCSVLQINVCHFVHCIVCLSTINHFLLSLWYLQTVLTKHESWTVYIA